MHDKVGTRYIASMLVQAKGHRSTTKLAEREFERIFRALTLSTGRGVDFEITGVNKITRGRPVTRREGVMFGTVTFLS